MKVTSIGLYSSNDVEVVNLSFRDPGSTNLYVAKNIVGLDADEIVPRFYGLAMGDEGKKFFDLSIPSREIVLSIMLNPEYGVADKTYSDLRDDIYKAISSSRSSLMRLKFYNGFEETAYINGFITKLEYEHFTDLPEIQLTLQCEDPMLRSPTRSFLAGKNNSFSSKFNVEDSTAPHGFTFTGMFAGPKPDFYMRDPAVTWKFTVTPIGGFLGGDTLHFSSESGNKHLWMIRAGVQTHLVDKIQPGSIWPILFPGENIIEHTDFVEWENILYYATYWGV